MLLINVYLREATNYLKICHQCGENKNLNINQIGIEQQSVRQQISSQKVM